MKPTLTRKQAAGLIERLRVFHAEWGQALDDADPRKMPAAVDVWAGLGDVLDTVDIPRLEACTGEAHSNGYIDNCSLCAPRWGWVGEKVKVT